MSTGGTMFAQHSAERGLIEDVEDVVRRATPALQKLSPQQLGTASCTMRWVSFIWAELRRWMTFISQQKPTIDSAQPTPITGVFSLSE